MFLPERQLLQEVYAEVSKNILPALDAGQYLVEELTQALVQVIDNDPYYQRLMILN